MRRIDANVIAGETGHDQGKVLAGLRSGYVTTSTGPRPASAKEFDDS